MTTETEARGVPTAARGGWYLPKMKRLTLEKWGQPDMFFEAVDVNSMLYGEMEELLSMRAKAAEDDTQAPLFVGILINRLLAGDWNLTDPATGEALPTPRTDPEVYKRLPTEVLMDMISQAMGAGEEGAVPPETGSEP